MSGPLNRNGLLIPGQRTVTATEVGAQALTTIADSSRVGLIAARSLAVAELALRMCGQQNIPLLDRETGEMLDSAPKMLDSAIRLACAIVDAADEAISQRIFPSPSPERLEEVAEEAPKEEKETAN